MSKSYNFLTLLLPQAWTDMWVEAVWQGEVLSSFQFVSLLSVSLRNSQGQVEARVVEEATKGFSSCIL